MLTEEELISLAIGRNARSRYRELLRKPKQRRKLLDGLNHNPPLDERYTSWYGTFEKALQAIHSIDGASQVRVLSATEEIDGSVMPFSEALEKAVGHGWGTIIGISTNLALYYGEGGERGAVVLWR